MRNSTSPKFLKTRAFPLISILLASLVFFSFQLSFKFTEKLYRGMPSTLSIHNRFIDSTLSDQHAVFTFSVAYRDIYMDTTAMEIELSCNGVIQHFTSTELKSHRLEVIPGKYKFLIYSPDNDEIIADSLEIFNRENIQLHLSFEARKPGVILYKPVIYAYSAKNTSFELKLNPYGAFTFTYPAYTDSWKCSTSSDGQLTVDGKTYPYLFWEAKRSKGFPEDNSGFFVKRQDVTSFLEKKLDEMNLNAKEKADFITFWGPKMNESPFGVARFIFNQDYNKDVAELTISPKPNSLFRVYLLWQPLNETPKDLPKTQEIQSANRSGFYLIEWGGSVIPSEN